MTYTPEQITEHRTKFLAALRSGEFTQARGRLRLASPDGGHSYCCLGVACEIYRRETGRGDWSGSYFEVEGNRSPSYLREPVVEWLGTGDYDPTLLDGIESGHVRTASLLNDNGTTFRDIADLFEAYFAQH